MSFFKRLKEKLIGSNEEEKLKDDLEQQESETQESDVVDVKEEKQREQIEVVLAEEEPVVEQIENEEL